MTWSKKDILRVLMQQRANCCAYLWSYVHDTHLAEDIYQDVCVEVLDRWRNFNDQTHLVRWLRKACRFRAIDALRKQGRSNVLFRSDLLDMVDAEWQLYDAADSEQLQENLNICMARLTPNARKIMDLRYRKQQGCDEIALRLGKKITAVYKAIARIHKSLGDCIRQKQKGGTL